MVKIPFPYICSPQTKKCRFILFQYTNVHLCAIYSQQPTKSDVLKFGPVSEQGTETKFHM